jgi:hypothetical protein
MSVAPPARAGVSAKEFQYYAAEAGQWLWGTVQGAYNEKQSASQIITDAVIGMIPVVGDVTAARDLVAVSTGLVDSPEKRESKMEWVLLVILIFALIPVIGGVIKGVGRLTLKVTSAAAKDSVALAKIADDIINFLNRIGHKNAEAWIKALDVLKYEREILTKFRDFCDVFIISIHRYALRFKSVLPQSFVSRMEQLSNGFQQLKKLGDKMIPQALKDLHERLDLLKKTIHAGGVPPPGKTKTLIAQTGQKTISYAEEARLIETGAAKKIVHAGKYGQNVASVERTSDIAKVYKKEAGFPDMLGRITEDEETGIKFYSNIASASGPIKNEIIQNETLFRAFGPKGTTHGINVWESKAIGPYWGRGAPPKTAKEWRGPCAVLDEWNRNGWLSMIHIPKGANIHACTSTVSEQFSKAIPGQFLEGGARQAFVEAFYEKQFMDATAQLYKKGGGKITLSNGIVVEVKQSGWSGINGKIGYGDTVIPGASMVERLGVTELQSKVVKQSAQAEAKHQRTK